MNMPYNFYEVSQYLLTKDTVNMLDDVVSDTQLAKLASDKLVNENSEYIVYNRLSIKNYILFASSKMVPYKTTIMTEKLHLLFKVLIAHSIHPFDRFYEYGQIAHILDTFNMKIPDYLITSVNRDCEDDITLSSVDPQDLIIFINIMCIAGFSKRK